MAITEERRAQLTFGTAGVDKLKQADGALDALERRAATVSKANRNITESHRLGGEQMAKYGTSVAALTGQMQRLPIAGDAISKSMGVVGDVIAGTLGAGGVAFIAVGAMVTMVAALVAKQKELEEKTRAATQAQIDQAAHRGGSMYPGATEATGTPTRLQMQAWSQDYARQLDVVAELQKKAADLETRVNRQQPAWGQALFGKRDMDSGLYNRLLGEYNRTLSEYNEAVNKAQGIRQALLSGYPSVAAITVSGSRNGASGGAAGAPSPYGYTPFGFVGPIAPARGPGGEFFRSGAGSDPRVDAAKQAAGASQEAWVTANENILGSFDRLTTGGKAMYRGMSGAIEGFSAGTSRIVESALMRESLHRMKGLEIVKFTAASGAAAAIQAVGDVAKTRAIEATAQGFLALGFIPGPTGAASSFKAAGLYGLLAGVSYGVAGAIRRGAERDFAAGMGGSGSYGGTVAGGDGASYDGTNPGARNAGAIATPQNIYYQAIWNQYGTVVYGQGGLRDWVQRELAPELRRLKELGQI